MLYYDYYDYIIMAQERFGMEDFMKTFEFERRGYNTDEVDQYVRELETKIEKKEAELAEYRKKEEAINQSVVEAKILANKIVEDAEEQAVDIRKEATEELSDLREQAKAMHEKIDIFQQEYNRIIQEYLVSLRSTALPKLFDDLNNFMNKYSTESQEEEIVDIADLRVDELL